MLNTHAGCQEIDSTGTHIHSFSLESVGNGPAGSGRSNRYIGKSGLLSETKNIQGSEQAIMKDRKENQIKDVIPREISGTSGNFGGCLRIVSISSQSRVGKSFLSLNLSHVLANAGSRVLLIDSNLNQPALHQVLRPTDNYPAVRFSSNYLELMESRIVHIEKNLDFLGNLQIDRKEAMENWWESVAAPELLWSLTSGYNQVIVDTHSGLNELTLALLQQADLGLVVSTPDLNSLYDTYSLMNAAVPFLSRPKLFLIINKILDKQDGEAAHKNLSFAFRNFQQSELALLGMVPGDSTAEFSCDDGNPLLPFCENGEIKEKLGEISQSLIELTPVILSGSLGDRS